MDSRLTKRTGSPNWESERGFLSSPSYARRLRREVIDIAGKPVRTASRTILKVTEATARRLDLKGLSRQVAVPPRFAWIWAEHVRHSERGNGEKLESYIRTGNVRPDRAENSC